MTALVITDLHARYERSGSEVLKGISLQVQEDDFLAIIGPSGAGKSTLIRCINRLVEPASGSIEFYGVEVTGLNRGQLRQTRCDIGMIFQEFNLVDRMTVLDNVLSGRLGHVGTLRSTVRWFPKDEVDYAVQLLHRVGLEEHAGKRADRLSGGQRQRVGIARALMQRPRLLLVDEPTSSLDPKIAREVMGLIKQMAREFRVPAVCNIHDVQLAMEFCNRIIGLQDGVEMFQGPPEKLDRRALDEIYAMEVL